MNNKIRNILIFIFGFLLLFISSSCSQRQRINFLHSTVSWDTGSVTYDNLETGTDGSVVTFIVENKKSEKMATYLDPVRASFKDGKDITLSYTKLEINGKETEAEKITDSETEKLIFSPSQKSVFKIYFPENFEDYNEVQIYFVESFVLYAAYDTSASE